jgi:puromycin-sensitive aminopeptidase
MSRKLLALVYCFCLVLSGSQVFNPAGALDIAASGGAVSSRLPAIAAPARYAMRIEPDLNKQTFAGNETISLEIFKPTSEILLNAAELKIDSASIKASVPDSSKIAADQIVEIASLEQIKMSFPSQLAPGKYELAISFSGILNDKLRGFYRSFYTDDKGVKHELATTQMEPTDARRMFPCFDEPSYKATYQITAVVGSDQAVISNAPILQQNSLPGDKKEVIFDDTPPMSTYLVTLIVGNFESTDEVRVGDIPIRVWSVTGKAKMGEYARGLAAKLLPYYVSYFGVPYPAKKLDLIAIPDFEAGAMENLGAITFRERELLVDQEKSSTETLQEVASVVAHEMAHLWFGDLVTMKWWDDLWLNEAFATWMSTKAVDYLMPQWHSWDEFGLARSQALWTDSLKSTRPIHFKVENPNQINEMFDEITYEKGASILRMLEQYVSPPTFQSGVQSYIRAHKFGNARTEDLWRAIGESSHLPVPEIMHGWVFQPGYPLISLSRATGSGQLTLLQKQFFLENAGTPQNTALWSVPVAIRPVAGDKKTVILLKAPAQPVDLAAGNGAVLANAGADGFYRVKYPAGVLKEIRPLVQSKLSSAERLGLLTDQWSLTISGQMPPAEYLSLTGSYRQEEDPFVVKALIGELDQLSSFIDASARPGFERLVRNRLGAIAQRLGWAGKPNEPDLVQILRGDVLEALGTIGQDQQTIAAARKLFEQYLTKHDSVDPDLLDAVTDIVAYNGGEKEYQKIKRLWKEAKTPEEEERNLLYLASFRKPELIARTLQMCISDEVRTQDQPRLLGHLLREDASKVAAWQFVKTNWGKITKRYPLNMVPRVVSATSSLTTAEQERDLRDFFKAHPVPAGEHAVSRMLERVRIAVAFRAHGVPAINNWLAQNP